MTATCTIRSAVTGICGEPAVSTFTIKGTTYGECAEHHLPAPVAAPSVAPGATVAVLHVGVKKYGVIETVGRTRATVKVPVGRGRTAGFKIITVPLAGLAVR